MADDWAERMLAIADSAPKKLILVIADMARSSPPMSGAFVAALARRLPGQSAALALPLTWIEQQLAELGLTMEQLVRAKSQQQAVDHVRIGNGIGSLRFLGAMDWRELVESIPPAARTLVVTPTMPGSARGIKAPLEALAVRFLANRDDHLHFGLPTDFRDAPTPTHPDGAGLSSRPKTRSTQGRISEAHPPSRPVADALRLSALRPKCPVCF